MHTRFRSRWDLASSESMPSKIYFVFHVLGSLISHYEWFTCSVRIIIIYIIDPQDHVACPWIYDQIDCCGIVQSLGLSTTVLIISISSKLVRFGLSSRWKMFLGDRVRSFSDPLVILFTDVLIMVPIRKQLKGSVQIAVSWDSERRNSSGEYPRTRNLTGSTRWSTLHCK